MYFTVFTFRSLCFCLCISVLNLLAFSDLAFNLQHFNRKQLLADLRTECVELREIYFLLRKISD